MAYRTVNNPGPDRKGGMLRGVKITTRAEIAINRILDAKLKIEAQKGIDTIRAGAAGLGDGTYHINNLTCYHRKFGGQGYALAFRYPPNDQYCYIEAVIKKSGAGNSYELV